MIKIKKKLVQFSSSEDAYGVMEAIINSQIAGTVETLTDKLYGVCCNKHPKAETVVTISGNLPRFGQAVSVNITKSCCSDFNEQLKLLMAVNAVTVHA